MRDPKPVKKQPKSGLVSRTVYKMPAHSKPKGPPPPEVGLDSIEPERLDYLSLYATARLRPDEFKTKDYPKYLMPPPRLSLIKCLFCDETITGFDKKTARQMWMQHQKRIHKFKFPTSMCSFAISWPVLNLGHVDRTKSEAHSTLSELEIGPPCSPSLSLRRHSRRRNL